MNYLNNANNEFPNKMKKAFTQKKPQEVYKDPVYGIPHFHDPALCRIIRKHDPSFQVSQSMKSLFVKSQQRLKAVQANRPRYMHSAYNIETLRTSPLMCFPHFQEMTEFIAKWFDSEKSRQESAKTTTQIATFEAQKRFCKGLFLLMQETARASPLSPVPLKGIYNWYLQRDSVINQSRNIDKNQADEGFYVIEMMNGQKLRIAKSYLELDSGKLPIVNQEQVDLLLKSIQPEHVEVVQEEVKKPNRRQVKLITETFPPHMPKKYSTTSNSGNEFDYEAFHGLMEQQRQAEKDTENIAKKEKELRRKEITQRIGWE